MINEWGSWLIERLSLKKIQGLIRPMKQSRSCCVEMPNHEITKGWIQCCTIVATYRWAAYLSKTWEDGGLINSLLNFDEIEIFNHFSKLKLAALRQRRRVFEVKGWSEGDKESETNKIRYMLDSFNFVALHDIPIHYHGRQNHHYHNPLGSFHWD